MRLSSHDRRLALTDKLLHIQDLMEECLESDDPIDQYTYTDLAVAKAKLVNKLERLNRPRTGQEITDEMVEQARAVDVATLIDFVRGRAVAWCHDDRNPSLSYNAKAKKAHCFVCNKSFNAVDVMIHKYGMNFTEAVRELCK